MRIELITNIENYDFRDNFHLQTWRIKIKCDFHCPKCYKSKECSSLHKNKILHSASHV